MANKPVIKFSAVPYMIGTGSSQRSGYRPQLERQRELSGHVGHERRQAG